MGKKFIFLVVIIGKTRFLVNIGDNTWSFVHKYDPDPYEKTVIIDVSTNFTGTKRSQLESDHIRKLKNYKKSLRANSAAQDLITSEINIHLITSIFDKVIGYK